jgi:drug/metabolite transporter (DMT)-like permease
MNWIAFILIGKLLIYLWQQFPLPVRLENSQTIYKLHSCDLCSGVWLYGLLSYFMGSSLLTLLGLSYIPVASELITGGVVSFVVHIFSIGWRDKFSPNLVIGE